MTRTHRHLITPFFVFTSLIATSGCAISTDLDSQDADTEGTTPISSKQQHLSGGCSLSNAVPLSGPNVSNRLGSNACASILAPHFLPDWWQYGDKTARVQIANFDDQDPVEDAFPLTVEWKNTCGTESGTVTYTQPWEQHELGHPEGNCSIVIKFGGNFSEDILIFWGA